MRRPRCFCCGCQLWSRARPWWWWSCTSLVPRPSLRRNLGAGRKREGKDDERVTVASIATRDWYKVESFPVFFTSSCSSPTNAPPIPCSEYLSDRLFQHERCLMEKHKWVAAIRSTRSFRTLLVGWQTHRSQRSLSPPYAWTSAGCSYRTVAHWT